MMKNVFFLLILMSVSVWAQNAYSQNRDFSLKILTNRGRPVRNVHVQSVSTGSKGFTNRQGLFVFRDLSDDDSISMMLPRYGETIVPVTGLDSIVVMLRSANSFSYVNNERQTVVINKSKTEPSTLLDVPLLLRQRGYTSLVSLLQGNAPGLNIRVGDSPGEVTANIRGTSSLKQSTEPLVLLDGIPLGPLSEADKAVNVYSIKTIEILKTAPEYGIRGTNGVILVKTNSDSQ